MLKYLFALVATISLCSISQAQYGYQYQYQYNYSYGYGYQKQAGPAFPYSYGPYGTYGYNPLLNRNYGYNHWYNQRPLAYPLYATPFVPRWSPGFWR